jgi:hypothetical protein
MNFTENTNKLFSSFFHREDIKKMSKEIVKPVVNIIYDEIYPYVWFICIYNVFLIFMTLLNLLILIQLFKELRKVGNLPFPYDPSLL